MKKRLLLLGGVIVLIAVVAAIYILSLFSQVSSVPGPGRKFVIPKGQAVSVIANRLAEEGFIKHPLAFRFVVWKNGLEDKLQAGSFTLYQDMSPAQIAGELTQGTTDLWVTIPEGWRREEIATSLDEQELEAFDKAEFLELSAADEGKLFPDTYLIARQSTAATIYSILTNTFEKKVTQGLADEIAASDRDFDDVLIMASIVEREARGTDDMRHVAGILWNRIDIGMALQADATLQYAKGLNKQTQSWWEPPVSADRQLNSPFNTYQNPGLPPRPISNPGLEAIEATLKPLPTDDIFYLHDRQGAIHYAKTLEEHNANIVKYLR